MNEPDRLSRARGCLLGQLAGDSLGSLVEFCTPSEIRQRYPDGVRELADGGTWNTVAGQPTDDSEMALQLARLLAEQGKYDPGEARKAYILWLNSEPFDCGMTVASGLRGRLNPDSQANGALMRISPLGIFGASFTSAAVAEWAREDAGLTHPHPVCQQANALFAMAIARAVGHGCSARNLYEQIVIWAQEMSADNSLLKTILEAGQAPPPDYIRQQGWVLIALGNALWQLLFSSSLEEAVVDTVMRGGDTDTNAAICGALMGAVYGREAIPDQWLESLLECRPEAGRANVHRPRPRHFWPSDALELAERLLNPGRNGFPPGP